MSDVWRNLSRHLGARSGLAWRPVAEDGASGPPAVLRPDDRGRRFLVVDAMAPSHRATHRTLLRMEPCGESTWARGGRELRDLASEGAPVEGAARADVEVAQPRTEVAILPPLYYCKEKGVWIAAVCPGCGGRPGALVEGLDPEACAVCGSRTDETGYRPETSGSPLESLWMRVNEKGRHLPDGATDDGRVPQPACVGCERRKTCFAPTGSRTKPKGAIAALVPVMPEAWVGSVVERFDLPLPSWLRWLDGVQVDSKVIVGDLPQAVAEDVVARFRGVQTRLVPREFGARASAEGLLVRIELLRRLLSGLRDIRRGLRHPHWDIRPSTVWVRLGMPPRIGPAGWSGEPLLIDLAPAAGPNGEWERPEALPKELTPPEIEAARESVSGLLIPRNETTDEGGGKIGVKFLFLAQGEGVEPPSEDEPLDVVVGDDEGRRMTFRARVEVAFEEVFRIVIFPGDLSADAFDAALTGQGAQARIVRGANDAGGKSVCDPDWFALGTLWLAALIGDATDLSEAARLRDALLQASVDERLDRLGHDVAERTCLRVASEERLAERIVPADATTEAPALEALLGRCLWLAARLCGAIPSMHSSDDGGAALDRGAELLLREIESLSGEARYLMLGRSTAEEEILSVLRSYEASRA